MGNQSRCSTFSFWKNEPPVRIVTSFPFCCKGLRQMIPSVGFGNLLWISREVIDDWESIANLWFHDFLDFLLFFWTFQKAGFCQPQYGTIRKLPKPRIKMQEEVEWSQGTSFFPPSEFDGLWAVCPKLFLIASSKSRDLYLLQKVQESLF